MITDANGDLVLEHKPTGGQFKFDSANNAWTPVQGLAMGGASISNAGNVDVGQSLVTQDLTVNGSATGLGVETVTRAFLSNPSSATTVPLDTVSFDADSNFDLTNNEYTVPSDGLYFLAANTQPDNSTGDYRCRINSATKGALIEGNTNNSSGFETIFMSDLRKLSAGDALSLLNLSNRTLRDGEFRTFLIVAKLTL
jgi:hypothetical protein